MVKLSPSTLSLFSECPRCFWFTHVANIKRPQTPFPSLPNGIDRVLKEYFDNHIGEITKSLPKEIAQLESDGHTLFSDLDKLEVWRNNFKGISYTDTQGNILMGAVDTLLQVENILIVLDFKTKGSEPNDMSASYYNAQLSIYTWLLAQNGYDVADHGYILFYYPTRIVSPNLVHFGHTLVKVYCETDVPKLFSDALTCLSLRKAPPANITCQFCQWHDKVKKKEFDDAVSTQESLCAFLE
jgi:hypothetical protein